MNWSHGLALAMAVIAAVAALGGFARHYFSVEEYEKRMIRRRRRDRRWAHEILRATSHRPHFNEYEGARKR